jgi:hypothetical protein
MSDDNDEVFQGFYDPRLYDGWTKMPHELIDDALCKIESLTELKIVLYIMRNTWGYAEFDIYKKITTDEFMHGRKRCDGTRMDNGTGLSDWGVKDGIAKALKHGYIECEKDDSDKGRIKKKYRLKLYQKD